MCIRDSTEIKDKTEPKCISNNIPSYRPDSSQIVIAYTACVHKKLYVKAYAEFQTDKSIYIFP